MSSVHSDDELDSVTQSSVPAAGAPPVASRAPNSVFALANAAPLAESEPPKLNLKETALLAHLEAGGKKSGELAKLTGLAHHQVNYVLQKLRGLRLVESTGVGTATCWHLYGAAPQAEREETANAKSVQPLGWKSPARKVPKAAKPAGKSAKKWKLAAGGPVKRAKASTKPKAPVVAAVTEIQHLVPIAPPPAPVLPAEADDLELGLIFNEGEVSLALAFEGQCPIRLNPRRTAKLRAWLDKMDLVLPEVEAA